MQEQLGEVSSRASPGPGSVRHESRSKGWAGVAGSGWGQARLGMTAAHLVIKRSKKRWPSRSFMDNDLLIVTFRRRA